jgi:deazaflavin-dependent oxidoreductase (nitroreductase family)
MRGGASWARRCTVALTTIPFPGPQDRVSTVIWQEAAVSAFDAEYEPSPWEPIAQEVERYERSGGAEPSELVGDQWIILWTLGATSGKVRKTPLVRIADGDGRYATIGSMGGAPTHPQWVHNVRAHPLVRLQDGTAVGEFSVREVDGDEKATWWARATAVWPDYDTYQASTDRVIPLFVLDPS